MFVGTLLDQGRPETATLIGHRTNGTDVTSAPVAVDSSGINKRLSVSSSSGDIESFTVVTEGPGDLAMDDLTMSFPANSLADMRPVVSGQVVPILSGGQATIPVSIARVNGSHGPVKVSITGLPQGVTASPVTTDTDSAQLVLEAAPDAPSTNFNIKTATITADPLNNADVGPSKRTTTVDIRVASPFDLRLADGTPRGRPRAGLRHRGRAGGPATRHLAKGHDQARASTACRPA